MSSLSSPEEMLDHFYRLLLKDKLKALEFFSRFAGENHTARLSAFIDDIVDVWRTDEYVVIRIRSPDGRLEDVFHLLIVGLDENYRFFCHPLSFGNGQENVLLDISLEDFDDYLIRGLMGFTHHAWEACWEEICEGMDIRLQGDIVVHVERVFRSEEELVVFLLYNLLFSGDYMFWEKFLNNFLVREFMETSEPRKLQRLVRMLMGIEELGYLMDPKDIESLMEMRRHLADNARGNITCIVPRFGAVPMWTYFDQGTWSIARKLLWRIMQDDPLEALRIVIEYYERRFRIRLHNHTITLIGIPYMPFVELRDEILVEPESIYLDFVLVREQIITAQHPEHGVASLKLPRSMISIGFLTTDQTLIQIAQQRHRILENQRQA